MIRLDKPIPDHNAESKLKAMALSAISKGLEDGSSFVLVSLQSGEVVTRGRDWKFVEDRPVLEPLAGDA